LLRLGWIIIGSGIVHRHVKTPQAITDGHLLELARKNSIQLVTFDQGIPNALYIG
jgi:hypothetical protein